MTAINQTGKKLLVSGVAAVFPPDTLKTLGPLAEGVLIPAIQADPTDNVPALADIRQTMDTVDKSAPLTSSAVLAWASAKVLAAAIPTIKGDITAASTFAALDALRDVDMEGAIHSFSAIELTNPLVKRSFNHYAINYIVQGGKFVRQGDFYDLAPVMEGLKF